MIKIKWVSVGNGLEYRKHPERKHGVRFDRYFRGRYTVAGNTTTIGFGWESEGHTATKSLKALLEFKGNAKTGKGFTTLKEKRVAAEEEKKQKELLKKQAERDGLTFSEVFEGHYLPKQQGDIKGWKNEEYTFNKWIKPILGDKALISISPFDIERIKKAMYDQQRSDRTVEACLKIIKHVFNFSGERELFAGENPLKKVKIPSPDNAKVRFLTEEQAEDLLLRLKEKTPKLSRMAEVSLFCGLRFGEIAGLTWADVGVQQGTLYIRGHQTKRTGPVYMPDRVSNMFAEMKQGNPSDFVFPARRKNKGRMTEPSNTFARVIDEMGLNDGITDRRQKITFHSCRHTFCSWLAMRGVELHVIQDLLGHKTLTMTQRYKHLAPQKLQSTVNILNDITKNKEDIKSVPLQIHR